MCPERPTKGPETQIRHDIFFHETVLQRSIQAVRKSYRRSQRGVQFLSGWGNLLVLVKATPRNKWILRRSKAAADSSPCSEEVFCRARDGREVCTHANHRRGFLCTPATRTAISCVCPRYHPTQPPKADPGVRSHAFSARVLSEIDSVGQRWLSQPLMSEYRGGGMQTRSEMLHSFHDRIDDSTHPQPLIKHDYHRWLLVGPGSLREHLPPRARPEGFRSVFQKPSSSDSSCTCRMQCPSAKQALINLEHAAERGMLHVASSSVKTNPLLPATPFSPLLSHIKTQHQHTPTHTDTHRRTEQGLKTYPIPPQRISLDIILLAFVLPHHPPNSSEEHAHHPH
jgi:hypothetical protein